ncbi:uncharacterized protein F4822DRAFT_425851 [Hypoxylon trugodes]|uniref:uncharacterized protein n=1 Tax=Hypoxylon trugodes TaxID=326681 RepID=UPI0021983399|nr:uncharacterized protein F4822DRAFT_425851 [Hypoxylon trugodes]KAI1392648.1 hypothetical protein F4822DRAFT_425851 [Hypoxylon trugodes]
MRLRWPCRFHFKGDGENPSQQALQGGVTQSKELSIPPITVVKTCEKPERFGLFPVHVSDPFDVDVVAVHGLGGDWEETWTDSDTGKMWLRDFLPLQFSNIRIWSFGYDSSYTLSQSVNTIDDAARSLIDGLAGERLKPSAKKKPIIFIAHSLGGIIVKKALILTNERSDHWEDLRDSAAGAILFGVPHRGSDIAWWADFVTSIFNYGTLGSVGNREVVKALKRNSPALSQISDSFIQLANNLKLIRTFYETMRIGNQIIVNKDSANLRLHNEVAIPIQGADHRNLCRFGNEESQKYRPVKNALYDMMRKVTEDSSPCSSCYQIPFSLQGVSVTMNFVPRPFDTAKIEQTLLPGCHSHGRKIFVLYGLGGIGKTQLAIDFTRHHHGKFSAVFWLDGSSEDNLKQSLASCIARVPEGQVSEESRKYLSHGKGNLDAVVIEMMEWLSRPDNTDWLLVFDNVDRKYPNNNPFHGAYDINRYLPSDHGSILITTRLARLAQLGDSKKLEKVGKVQAHAIFQRWYGMNLDLVDTIDLLDLLDGLPLALAQAAAYLRETKLEFSSYIRHYKEQWNLLMKDEPYPPLIDYEKQHSLSTTWWISFNAIKDISVEATELLMLWAFLDNKVLWYGLLQSVANSTMNLPEWLRKLATDQLTFTRAIRVLLNYSIIEEGEGKESYSMHPVVHKWVLGIQVGKRRVEFMKLAVIVVGMCVRSRNGKDWNFHRRLVRHAETCRAWISSDKGAMYRMDTDEQPYEKGISAVLNAAHYLGDLFRSQGKLTESEEMYRYALNGKEQILGPDSRSTLDTVNNLGVLYQNKGQLESAEKMYRRALKGREQELGPNHVSTLGTVNNLGLLYVDQNEFDKAKEMYQRALEGREKHLGPAHPLTLRIISNFAVLHMKQHDLQRAEKMYWRALDGYKNTLGADHILAINITYNMGALYTKQGKLREAKGMYQHALEGYKKALGPGDALTYSAAYKLINPYAKETPMEWTIPEEESHVSTSRSPLEDLENFCHDSGWGSPTCECSAGILGYTCRILINRRRVLSYGPCESPQIARERGAQNTLLLGRLLFTNEPYENYKKFISLPKEYRRPRSIFQSSYNSGSTTATGNKPRSDFRSLYGSASTTAAGRSALTCRGWEMPRFLPPETTVSLEM